MKEIFNRNKTLTITITNRTILRTIVWIAVAVIAFRQVSHAAHALTLIFISFFLALALNPVVGWVSHKLKTKSRSRATAVAYVSVLVILIGFFAAIIPPLVNQTRDFINDVPRIVSDFQQQDNQVAHFARKHNIDDQLSKSARELANRYGAAKPVIDTGKRIGATFVSIITVIVMTFMMLVEGPYWLELLWRTMPANKREHRKQLAQKMYRMVTGFVNGQVILAGIAATFCLLALLISSQLVNVSVNAIALAGIVAIFGLIPMIGNPISSSLVIFVCLLSSVNLAIIMLIYFLIYYQIENITLQPYIQSRQNKLSPLTVFLAAILGISLGGVIGALAAIPIVGSIKILIENHFVLKTETKKAD